MVRQPQIVNSYAGTVPLSRKINCCCFRSKLSPIWISLSCCRAAATTLLYPRSVPRTVFRLLLTAHSDRSMPLVSPPHVFVRWPKRFRPTDAWRHFLIGSSLKAIPEPVLEEVSINRWNILQLTLKGIARLLEKMAPRIFLRITSQDQTMAASSSCRSGQAGSKQHFNFPKILTLILILFELWQCKTNWFSSKTKSWNE